LLAAIAAALEVELSELFAEVAATLRREEKLAAGAIAGGRLAALPGAGSARIVPAPPRNGAKGGVAVQAVRSFAA
jgi:hypothetical protein